MFNLCICFTIVLANLIVLTEKITTNTKSNAEFLIPVSPRAARERSERERSTLFKN
jgi:hypothetical protein